MIQTDSPAGHPDTAHEHDIWAAVEGGDTRKERKLTASARRKLLAGGAALLVAAGLTTGITAAALNTARDDAGRALSRAEELFAPRKDAAIELVGYLIKSPPLERDTIDPLILAANMASVNAPDAGGAGKKFTRYSAAQAAVESSLRQFKATTGRHPDLQANKGFAAAMRKLDAAEPGVAAARAAYNEAAARYNSIRGSFPGALLAPALGHDTPWGTLTAP